MLSLPTKPVLGLLVGEDVMGDGHIAGRPRSLLDLDVLVLVDLRRRWVVLMDRRPSPLRLLLLRPRTGLPPSMPLPMSINRPASSIPHTRAGATSSGLQRPQPLLLQPSRLLPIHALCSRTDPTMPLLRHLSGVHDVEAGGMAPSGAVVAGDGEAVVEREAADAVDSLVRRFFRSIR